MKKKTQIFLMVLLVAIAGVSGYLLFDFKGDQMPNLVIRNNDANSSAEYANAQRAANYYLDLIEKDPDVVRNYVELAQIFIQQARVTGLDHEFIAKANSVIDIALSKEPENIEALVTKSSILLTLHRFDEVKPIIEKVVAKQPYYAHAYGVLCDTYVELGEYEKAIEACDKMLNIRPDLRSYSRASYLRELHGDKDAAIEAMKLAADAGVWGSENRAWSLYNMANLFLTEGKLDTAAYIFKGMLEERPNYAYALSGQAKIEIIRKNYKKAEELLKRAHESAPVHTFIEQLAELYKITGNRVKEGGMIELMMDEFANHENDGYNVDLEYARFCLNHNFNISEAYERIKKEYQRRPGNIEVLDTYAAILHKMGENNKAVPYILKAVRLKTISPSMYVHAGEIFYSLEQFDRAVTFYHKALSQNPYYDVMYAGKISEKILSVKTMLATNN